MDFSRQWTEFALDAEVEHFGTTRIAKAHNALMARVADLEQAIRTDAARYRWLRSQNWNDGVLGVVVNPKTAVKLGHDCPSHDRLDDAIDAEMVSA